MRSDAYLLLENGRVFPGKKFGADVSVDGEVGGFLLFICLSGNLDLSLLRKDVW